MQRLRATLDNVPKGHYHLLLLKSTQTCTANSSFTIDVTATDRSSGWKLLNTYYNPIYDDMNNIATNTFQIHEDGCTVLVEFDRLPVGLKSVHLQKVQHGQLAIVSPQWVKITPSSDYPHWDTCAGSGTGDAFWISLRVGTYAELGRMGPRTSFLYGRHGSYREESAPYATFQGKAFYPAVLVNVDQFEWVTTTMSDAHQFRSRAVPLGISCDGVLHAARVLFYGWEEQRVVQQDQRVMKVSGQVQSVLPGKFEFVGNSTTARAMFTWEGKATGGHAVRLGEGQEVQILCYKVY